jgi:hypothetical protein
VTTSGALVTLLFAFAAFGQNATKSLVLPTTAQAFLAIALALFVLASIAGLSTNFPVRYDQISAKSIGRRLAQRGRSPAQAERDVALGRLTVLTDAKEQNERKGKLLFWALLLEVLAVLAVAVAVAQLFCLFPPSQRRLTL